MNCELLQAEYEESADLYFIFTGYKEFSQDIAMMLGKQPNIYWKVCWLGLTPAIITALVVFNIAYYKPPSLGDYYYPHWAQGLGWLIGLFPIALILFFFVYNFCTRGGYRVSHDAFLCFLYTENWGIVEISCSL